MKKHLDRTPLMLGPGPSNVPLEVLEALGRPTVGHLDPNFLQVMDNVQALLRKLFRTENQVTFPVSGTGSAGMELLFHNLIEPGDEVLIVEAGIFGQRMVEMARALKANVTRVPIPPGSTADEQDVMKISKGKKFKLFALVHGETSTGALQDLSWCSQVAQKLGALLLVDCVTTLGGVKFEMDRLGVDAAFSGTQKCLSCPPGLSPISLSNRAMKVIRERGEVESRRIPVKTWYFDLLKITDYWSHNGKSKQKVTRAYHHTAPVNMIFALEAALLLILEEGLDSIQRRHQQVANTLYEVLLDRGFSLFVSQIRDRLPPLTTAIPPERYSEEFRAEGKLRKRIYDRHNIEVGAGMGILHGIGWRIGLMGTNAHLSSVEKLTDALDCLLKK